jgi:hypothetical protein
MVKLTMFLGQIQGLLRMMEESPFLWGGINFTPEIQHELSLKLIAYSLFLFWKYKNFNKTVFFFI